MTTAALYGRSLALLTDLYQLTMALGYWRNGMAQREAVFHLFFRRNPFDGEFSVACGLAAAIDFIERFRFEPDDLEYLAGLRGSDGAALFPSDFLHYLAELKLTCDLHAMPEGTVVFPQEPLVRVTGPLLECQLLETPLLNLINFSTLIATKAARVCLAADGDEVIEFGLRRAQGIDGGVTASRAAYVGGCQSTSNVLAGRLFEIPVRGTHAHSWVMAFDDELAAFEAYAEAQPANCVFLVDTYETLAGVRHAIEAAHRLRERGHEMLGVRLDSGDLAALSIAARRMLDEAAFPAAKIVASGDLNEHEIAKLKRRGARIDIWGVGTHLATAFDQPALGGVYKLSAIRSADGRWQHRAKRSDDLAKATIPGIHQVRRFRDAAGLFLGDVIYSEPHSIRHTLEAVNLADKTTMTFGAATPHEDLLAEVFRRGERVYQPPQLAETRQRALEQVNHLPAVVTGLENPQPYPVGLERRVAELREALLAQPDG
jgi:nicotinate phosphoribosyltransferase